MRHLKIYNLIQISELVMNNAGYRKWNCQIYMRQIITGYIDWITGYITKESLRIQIARIYTRQIN